MTETRSGAGVRTWSTQTEPAPTAWTGWIAFAGTMMVMIGAFHGIQGFLALTRDDYYLVGSEGLIVTLDYTSWGWTHVLLGTLLVASGLALIAGQMWARVIAVILAFGSAIANFAFLAAYPVWSTMMIAIDVVIIWAVIVHGREMKSMGN